MYITGILKIETNITVSITIAASRIGRALNLVRICVETFKIVVTVDTDNITQSDQRKRSNLPINSKNEYYLQISLKPVTNSTK